PRTVRQRLRQQILGRPTRRAYSGLLRARPPTPCVPRDFDVSPYFDLVKFNPPDVAAFDYPRPEWGGKTPQGRFRHPGNRIPGRCPSPRRTGPRSPATAPE